MSQSVIRMFDVMSTDLVTATIDEVLSETVTRMLERNVGCIIVKDREIVVGIITKGDLLKKAFLKGLSASKVSAKNVMSSPVSTIGSDATLEEAARLMSAKKVSKLPVLKGKKLVGIVTSSDVIRAEPTEVGYLQELVKARFVPYDLR